MLEEMRGIDFRRCFDQGRGGHFSGPQKRSQFLVTSTVIQLPLPVLFPAPTSTKISLLSLRKRRTFCFESQCFMEIAAIPAMWTAKGGFLLDQHFACCLHYVSCLTQVRAASSEMWRVVRHGEPSATEFAGISRTTTLPAPMTECSPMRTPPRMIDPAPTHTPSSMTIGLGSTTPRSPRPHGVKISWLPEMMMNTRLQYRK